MPIISTRLIALAVMLYVIDKAEIVLEAAAAAPDSSSLPAPPPPKISNGSPTNTSTTTASSLLLSLGARLAAAADDCERAAIAAKATFKEYVALVEEQRSTLLKGTAGSADVNVRLEGAARALPQMRFAPIVEFAQLPTPGPVPPALTTPPRPPPSPEQRAKLQMLQEYLAKGGVIKTASKDANTTTTNHKRGGRAFNGATFSDVVLPPSTAGPPQNSYTYTIIPGSYWVRFKNGFYLCAFDDGTVRQSPRMYGWERITVLPGPEPGSYYLYTYFHNKYIVDPMPFIYSPVSHGNDISETPIQSQTPDVSFYNQIPDSPRYLNLLRIQWNGELGNYPPSDRYGYNVVSRRIFFEIGPEYTFATYLQAPTTGEYHYFRFKDLQTVPSPQIDFISVRTLAAGEFWVRTYHGQFMCVHQDHVEAGTNQQAWERIRVIQANESIYGRNRYHLWSDAHQRYLAFEHNGLGLRTYTDSWETFRIVSHPKHYESFSIYSDFHGKFLRQACSGCGFDATGNNSDAQNTDVTAFDFLPIEWYSHTPFFNTNTQFKPFRFHATGKYLKFTNDFGAMVSVQSTPFGIATIRAFDFPGYSGYVIAYVNHLGWWVALHHNSDTDGSLQTVIVSSSTLQAGSFHDIMAHPKIPNRYVIRLCFSCEHATYLAVHPDGNSVTTTDDAASDYTAIDIIF